MKYRITSLTVCMYILISKIYNVMTEVSTGKINDFVSKVLEPQSKYDCTDIMNKLNILGMR